MRHRIPASPVTLPLRLPLERVDASTLTPPRSSFSLLLQLKKASEMDPRPYKTKLVPYKSKGKARAKFNAEWDAERNWLSERLRE